MKSQDELKKEAGYRAADLVEDGMTVGLGTGSTVRYLLDALGERIKKDGVHFIGVPTSKRTADYGRELGMEIKSLDDVDQIDITIDGADEVDPDLNGIKGGGGAQTWEKLVATNSKTCAWIVDESKVVDQLGKFPLPVEVLAYGHKQLVKRMADLGYRPEVRLVDGQPFETDEGNIIIDLHLDQIDDPYALADKLSNMTGVVEHGLFLDMTQTVVIGGQDGTKLMNK
ncbi:ribose-5-phosphate isomerase RpiA [Secundilactobacillus kimchicus]|uniref:Ribose-5-phosphate isomerase A n=1 Tax=Secundilactobacillus kimchicus JCM 15530 TaxID=1302272 RepID=A0A0R1HL73_9LACO|nr:ribose-5-phosphate isomerase RpiA [Secundilactobacillus kimchicus]KRK47486.1 ribose 5-phosphate isomerase A [Secundilactobacillus kimchicus JCM 15530]MBT9671608.1 ribose-5-phosphate isomerase RpiA [Secundilactobacillus kimchicus]